MTIKEFFSFNGRTRRKHYLFAYLPVAAVAFLLGLLQGSTQLDLRIFLVPFVALLIPATARRLHDMGYSGWLVIAVFILPILTLLLLLLPGMGMANAYGPDPKAQIA